MFMQLVMKPIHSLRLALLKSYSFKKARDYCECQGSHFFATVYMMRAIFTNNLAPRSFNIFHFSPWNKVAFGFSGRRLSGFHSEHIDHHHSISSYADLLMKPCLRYTQIQISMVTNRNVSAAICTSGTSPAGFETGTVSIIRRWCFRHLYSWPAWWYVMRDVCTERTSQPHCRNSEMQPAGCINSVSMPRDRLH